LFFLKKVFFFRLVLFFLKKVLFLKKNKTCWKLSLILFYLFLNFKAFYFLLKNFKVKYDFFETIGCHLFLYLLFFFFILIEKSIFEYSVIFDLT